MLVAVSTGPDQVAQFITVLFIFLFVLVITYYTTRWIAGFQKEKMTGKNVEIIETLKISQNKYVQILRTGEKYIVIAISKDGVTMLTEVEAEKIILPETNSAVAQLDFKAILEKAKKRAKKNEE